MCGVSSSPKSALIAEEIVLVNLSRYGDIPEFFKTLTTLGAPRLPIYRVCESKEAD